MSKQADKWKRILQSRDATQEQKRRAAEGLLGRGVRQDIIKCWSRQGAVNPVTDPLDRAKQLKWILTQSNATSGRKQNAIEEALALGFSWDAIQQWINPEVSIFSQII